MQLTPDLEQLPARFDAARLAAECESLGDHEWLALADSALGSAGVPLVSPGGARCFDLALTGAPRPTSVLARSPYLQEVLCRLGVPIARSYLVRLAAGTEAPACAGWNYHFFRRDSICVPVISAPAVRFCCGESEVQMSDGEAWAMNPRRHHRLRNDSDKSCVHLVIDTQDLAPARTAQRGGPSLHLESYRFEVITPEELSRLLDQIRDAVQAQTLSEPIRERIAGSLADFQRRWTEVFAQYGHSSASELSYQTLILDLRDAVIPYLRANTVAMQAVGPIDSMLCMAPLPPRRFLRPTVRRRADLSENLVCPDFQRPLFVLSAPRAGSTLLFELLSRLPEVWTIRTESHEILRGIPELHPKKRGYESDRLTAADCSPEVSHALRAGFLQKLVDRSGQSYLSLPRSQRPHRVRFVEKTPANALRIPFLRAAFPDALFIYLSRDPWENISSMIEGWRSRRFISHRQLPGWPHRDWSFLLPPGWQELDRRSIAEIATYQWRTATRTIEEELAALPESTWRRVDYQSLIQRPADVLYLISQFAELKLDDAAEQMVSAELPLSHATVSVPSSDKWRRHAEELTPLLSPR